MYINTCLYMYMRLSIYILFVNVNKRNAGHTRTTHFQLLNWNFLRWKLAHPLWQSNPRPPDYTRSALIAELWECDILQLMEYCLFVIKKKIKTRQTQKCEIIWYLFHTNFAQLLCIWYELDKSINVCIAYANNWCNRARKTWLTILLSLNLAFFFL